MTILLTRSESDSILLKKELESKTKASVIIEPMIETVVEPKSESLDLSQYESFIFTSRNAVSYLSQYDCTGLLNKKCFAIGSSTKLALESIGFRNIYNADSNIEKVVEEVLREDGSRSLYFRGEIISKDIKKDLSCDEIVCYKVFCATKFSKDLITRLKEGDIKVILFFSENTARTFLSLCAKYDIANFLKAITILTVSNKLSRFINLGAGSKTKSFEGDKNLLIELINMLYV